MKITILALTALAGVFALASPSMAATITLKASLSGKAEVPPNTVPATGAVTATYDDATKKLTWKGSYKDLSQVRQPPPISTVRPPRERTLA